MQTTQISLQPFHFIRALNTISTYRTSSKLIPRNPGNWLAHFTFNSPCPLFHKGNIEVDEDNDEIFDTRLYDLYFLKVEFSVERA
jgi:hypothetical protein